MLCSVNNDSKTMNYRRNATRSWYHGLAQSLRCFQCRNCHNLKTKQTLKHFEMVFYETIFGIKRSTTYLSLKMLPSFPLLINPQSTVKYQYITVVANFSNVAKIDITVVHQVFKVTWQCIWDWNWMIMRGCMGHLQTEGGLDFVEHKMTQIRSEEAA